MDEALAEVGAGKCHSAKQNKNTWFEEAEKEKEDLYDKLKKRKAQKEKSLS